MRAFPKSRPLLLPGGVRHLPRGELRREVLRLGLMCDKKLYEALLEGSKTMGETQLLAMKASFEERLSEKMPITTQIPGRDDAVSFDGSSYLV